MPYTLWSRGELLGHTDFELTVVDGPRRIGTFRPTPIGGGLLPTLCGLGPAVLSLEAQFTRARLTAAKIREMSPAECHGVFIAAKEGRRVMSLARQIDSLKLELRDAVGRRIKTDFIAVNDLERLLAEARAKRIGTSTMGPDDRPPGRPRYIISAIVTRRILAS